MSFTRKEVKALRVTLNKEFATIGKKHNIKFNFDNMSFGDEVRFKLHITKPSTTKNNGLGDINITSVKPTSARSVFESYAEQRGLKPTDFGRKFKIRNSTYTITGIKPNAPKYCIKVETGRGAKYVMPACDVIKNLG